jgi:ABC-type uncharacterized transport system substrate-binding protein
MSYGPNHTALLRKAARHVDKILKGAKPADFPVECPTSRLSMPVREPAPSARATGLAIAHQA